jgi:hypothetical protein
MSVSHWTVLMCGLMVAGCGKESERASRASDTGGMMGQMDSGMKMGDSGMQMGGMNMQGMQMMPGMQAHMDSMIAMSPQQMQSMMASHVAMMSRMIDGMGADMRGMKLSGSPEWNALTDSSS